MQDAGPKLVDSASAFVKPRAPVAAAASPPPAPQSEPESGSADGAPDWLEQAAANAAAADAPTSAEAADATLVLCRLIPGLPYLAALCSEVQVWLCLGRPAQHRAALQLADPANPILQNEHLLEGILKLAHSTDSSFASLSHRIAAQAALLHLARIKKDAPDIQLLDWLGGDEEFDDALIQLIGEDRETLIIMLSFFAVLPSKAASVSLFRRWRVDRNASRRR